MEKRTTIAQAAPAGYKAMIAFDSYMAATSIQPLHKELIKIRASQINGCAYCIDTHSRDARKLGETEQRIYALMAWWETLFSVKRKKPYWRLPKK